jgi:hypothetical protein
LLDNYLISIAPIATQAANDGPSTSLLHLRFKEDVPKVDDFAGHLWEQCFYYALPKRRQQAFLKEIERNPSVMLRAVKAIRDSFITFNEKNPTRASEVAEA